MLRASALYIVIVIALVIAVICSSLVVSAYYYRLQYQKAFRYDQLRTNVGSAINLLIAGDDTSYSSKTLSLFGMDADSVSTQRIFWGAYDIGIAKAMIQVDTLYKVFSIANVIDSTKWAALYLTDNDRPISVSGKTMINGDGFIPSSGVQQAYIDNHPYTGDKRLITGTRHNSNKDLPALDSNRINNFEQMIAKGHGTDSRLPDTLQNSFLLPVHIINLGNNVQVLKNTRLNGNIILFSDTALTIDSTAQLNNVLIFAKSISVQSGFHGTCQLFATDTIGIAKNCRFDYPSCLGILRFNTSSLVSGQAKICFYGKNLFRGLIFTYQKQKSNTPPLVHISGTTIIKGMVYSQGYTEFQSFSEIDGSVFTNSFLYQSTFTRYENYLNNTTINSTGLSPYYLISDLTPVASKKKKVLQWLETN